MATPHPSHQRSAILLTALLALVATPATAATCAEDVQDLARRYALEPAVPAGLGEADPEISLEDLQRSGGVIAPPPTGDDPVIEPQVTPPMPTAPPVLENGPDVLPDSVEDGATAAMAQQAEGLLGSALASAAQGDEASCSARLEEARAILSSPMPGAAIPGGSRRHPGS